MESSLNKINLVQYECEITPFYKTYVSKDNLNYFLSTNNKKILRFYISHIKKSILIIEVILKDF